MKFSWLGLLLLYRFSDLPQLEPPRRAEWTYWAPWWVAAIRTAGAHGVRCYRVAKWPRSVLPVEDSSVTLSFAQNADKFRVKLSRNWRRGRRLSAACFQKRRHSAEKKLRQCKLSK